jgi:Geranylgeranyl pyrophosphate synthase
MNIERYMSNQKNLFNKDLKSFFDKYKTSNILQRAMWYSLSNGGKRLRPILLAEVSKSVGLIKTNYLNLMLATELIHCYSLVHDDLPSMDDDDYRRGKLSTHKKFNEAQGICQEMGF